MTTAEEPEDPVINAALVNTEASEASKHLVFILMVTGRAAARRSTQDQEKGSQRGVRRAAALNHVSRPASRECC